MIKKSIYRLIALLMFMTAAPAVAQEFIPQLPIYIVNGKRVSEEQVREIDPSDIVENKLLPADEHAIELYGQDASNGVVVITLRYDTEAEFIVGQERENYSNYVAEMVKWEEPNPAARVIISFTVNPDGSVSEQSVLEATDRRLLKRIRKAMAEAPRWKPALKDGKGVATQHLLRITLPKGRTPYRKRVVIIR